MNQLRKVTAYSCWQFTLKCALVFAWLSASGASLAQADEAVMPKPTERAPADLDTSFYKDALDPITSSKPRAPVMNAKDPLPKMEIREAAFEFSNMTAELVGWDELEKDVLYRRTRKYDVAKLQDLYPNLPAQKLKQLKRYISELPQTTQQ